MKNLWEVVGWLVANSSMSDAEKAQAQALIEVHLAQHLGIAGQLGEHREHIKELRGAAGLTDGTAGMLGRADAVAEAAGETP